MTVQNPPRAARNVVVIAPAVVPHDAISAAAADTCRMLMGMPDVEVQLITSWCTVPDLPVVQVSGLADMLRNRAFLDADLLIYHFGIHHPLFDAILVGNGRARQVVQFHNVTPRQFLENAVGFGTEHAMRQMHNLERADVVWGDSATNLAALRENGILPAATAVMPLVVDAPARRSLAGKRGERVEILYLGRFVRSKGVLELLRALNVLSRSHARAFRLRLAGNEAYSSPDYVAQLRAATLELGPSAEYLGQVSDVERDVLLQQSHVLAIPSYHEGFCKPVVEALRAGCVPVGFAAYNLPDICAGLGRLVAPGDVAALAAALGEVIDDIGAVIAGRASSSLRLDCGALPLSDFDRRVLEHTQKFERQGLQDRRRDAVRDLLVGHMERSDP